VISHRRTSVGRPWLLKLLKGSLRHDDKRRHRTF